MKVALPLDRSLTDTARLGNHFTGSSPINMESHLDVQDRKWFGSIGMNLRVKETKVNFLDKVKLVIWTVRISSALISSVTGKLSLLNRATTFSSSPRESISIDSQASAQGI